MIVKDTPAMINWLNKTILDKFCQHFISGTYKKTKIIPDNLSIDHAWGWSDRTGNWIAFIEKLKISHIFFW